MKTIKVLPTVNNIDFCGRVVRDPYISGKTMFFDLIRNFGGDKSPVSMSFVMYKPKNGDFPAFLKKGAPIVAHAYYSPVSYTDHEGKTVENVYKVIKTVEEAVLVEKKVADDEASQAAEDKGAESNVEINEG